MSLRERAYQSFTRHLLDRDLTPGQFVSQRELVALTGYPLGAVREMIPRLESDGLIRTVPHRGLQIAHLDMDLIRNAFQLRLMVEREAVAHFAEHAPMTRIDALRDAHLRIRALAEREVTPELNQEAQQLDWDMHDEMVAALSNSLITNIYRVNSIKIRLIRSEDTRMLPELVVSVMDEHLALIEALAQRDKAASVAALETHVASAKRRVVRV